jgi:hypothetical protein
MNERPTPETTEAVERIRADQGILQGDEIDELAKVCERIESQRDGLLEALEDWLRVEDDSEDYFEAQGMKREPDHWVVAKARGAIAAVKEGKQP